MMYVNLPQVDTSDNPVTHKSQRIHSILTNEIHLDISFAFSVFNRKKDKIYLFAFTNLLLFTVSLRKWFKWKQEWKEYRF